MFSFFKFSPRSQKVSKTGETVQYLIARQDLNMSPGKMAAQCSHAATGMALAFYSNFRTIANVTQLENFRAALNCWQSRSFGKVVLRVKTRDQLIKICKDLDESKIPYCPIFDACRTELEPEEANGTVFTCIGITPMFRDEVPNYLKKLQVYH